MFPIPVFIAPSEDRGPLPAIPYNPDSPDISEPSEVAANPTSEAKEDIKKDTEEEPTKPRRVIRNEIAHPLHPIYELSHLEAYKNCVRDIVKAIHTMHETGYYHGNINPNTMLFASTGSSEQGVLLDIDDEWNIKEPSKFVPDYFNSQPEVNDPYESSQSDSDSQA